MYGVREPERRHRVFFKHPVDPRLANLGRALATEESVTIVKDILDLVERNESPTLPEKTLGSTKCAQTAFTIHGITIGIFTSHLK